MAAQKSAMRLIIAEKEATISGKTMDGEASALHLLE